MKIRVDKLDISIALTQCGFIGLVRKLDDSAIFHAELWPIEPIPQECQVMIQYLESH